MHAEATKLTGRGYSYLLKVRLNTFLQGTSYISYYLPSNIVSYPFCLYTLPISFHLSNASIFFTNLHSKSLYFIYKITLISLKKFHLTKDAAVSKVTTLLYKRLIVNTCCLYIWHLFSFANCNKNGSNLFFSVIEFSFCEMATKKTFFI